MSVEQSGTITPGHRVKWVSQNVIGDAGPLGANLPVLGYLLSADFAATSDQPIVLPSTMTAFQLTGIVIANTTLSLTTAAGGFYPEAAKGGTPIVAASQVYSALTTSAKLMEATLASFGSTSYFTRSILEDWAIYFSLTTGQGANAYADIYLIGNDLTIYAS